MDDSNPMSHIKHVVYYMLENRSFDNVLGWLYDPATKPSGLNIIANFRQKDDPFYGLEENKYFNYFEDGEKCFVKRGLPVDESAEKQFDTPTTGRNADLRTLSPGVSGARGRTSERQAPIWCLLLGWHD